jgi:hypothetical protein
MVRPTGSVRISRLLAGHIDPLAIDTHKVVYVTGLTVDIANRGTAGVADLGQAQCPQGT